METFNYKCPDCGANVEFDPKTNLLFCAYCGQFYPVEKANTNVEVQEEKKENDWHSDESINVKISINGNETNSDSPVNKEYTNVESYNPEFMEMNIFHCSSCGAEVMANDVEASKRCAYCGQSTIIFDRVSREQRPDKILPFGLTKEDAVEIAKRRFSEAKYLPDEAKNIEVDSVYGIYMPYWIYDSHMAMGVNARVKTDNGYETFKESGTKDMFVALDASKKLNDDISLMLNPFPVENAVDFDAAYLSGFYADAFDVPYESRKQDAIRVISNALEDELTSKLPIGYDEQIRDTYGDIYKKLGAVQTETYGEKYTLKGIYYAFVPLYFLTFRVKNRRTNILINGVTGKIVGSVPVDEKKVNKSKIRDMIIMSLIFGPIGAAFFGFFPVYWCAFLFAILIFSAIATSTRAKEKYERVQREANTSEMFSISNNRE